MSNGGEEVSVGFSLTRGGLFYTVLRRLGLARGDERDLRRQVIAFIAIGWAPFALASVLEPLLGVDPASLVRDPSVHVRLLIAVPLYVVAEHSLDRRCGYAIDRFANGRFSADTNAVERLVRSAGRLRDSWWPELILGGVILLSPFLLSGGTSLGLGESGTKALSATWLWYALVGLPLVQFLLLRTLWRWLIWSRLLWQLSRLHLRLVPTHPDLAGGIGHLAQPVGGMVIALLGSSATLAAGWAHEILAGRASLPNFATPFGLLVVLGEIIALGPLLFFTRHLIRARLEGHLQYSALAHRYTVDFHARWIERRNQTDLELLGTPDLQSLADLSNSFNVVDNLRVVPFGPRLLYVVFAVLLAPMLPLFLTVMSVFEIVAKIGGALLGG